MEKDKQRRMYDQALKLICEIPRGAQSFCFVLLANVITTIVLYKFFGDIIDTSKLVLCGSWILSFFAMVNALGSIIDNYLFKKRVSRNISDIIQKVMKREILPLMRKMSTEELQRRSRDGE